MDESDFSRAPRCTALGTYFQQAVIVQANSRRPAAFQRAISPVCRRFARSLAAERRFRRGCPARGATNLEFDVRFAWFMEKSSRGACRFPLVCRRSGCPTIVVGNGSDRDLAMNPRRWPVRMTRRRFLAASAAAACGVGVYAWRIEPHWIDVVTRDLPIAGLPAALHDRTLVQISDLHVGSVVDSDYLIHALGAFPDSARL